MWLNTQRECRGKQGHDHSLTNNTEVLKVGGAPHEGQSAIAAGGGIDFYKNGVGFTKYAGIGCGVLKHLPQFWGKMDIS